MAEAGTQPKRSFRPAWRKDGGSFGAPTTPKQEEPEEQQNGAPKGWRGLPGGAPFCGSSSGSSCLGVVGAPKDPPSLRHAGRKLRLGCVPASAIAADPQVSPRCGGFLVFF